MLKRIALVLSVSGPLAVECRAGQYTAINLNPGGNNSLAYAVDNGVEGGTAAQPGYRVSLATTWTGSAASNHPMPVSDAISGSQINGIAGSLMVGTGDTSQGNRVIRYMNGVAYEPELPSGYSQTYGTGVSPTQIVGYGQLPTALTYQALLYVNYDDRYPISLQQLGYQASQAFGVDNGHQVGFQTANTGYDNAFIWSNTRNSGQNIQPDDFIDSRALAIQGNDIAGWAGTSTGRHAVLWTTLGSNVVTDLAPAGTFDSQAAGVANGVVVGEVDSRAAVWTNGTQASYLDLQQFLPANFTESAALGVDNQGDIVGYAYDPANNGQFEAFLWTVPEPATTSLLAAAIAGLLIRPRRTRLKL